MNVMCHRSRLLALCAMTPSRTWSIVSTVSCAMSSLTLQKFRI